MRTLSRSASLTFSLVNCRVRNSAARLVAHCSRLEHDTPVLRKLNWLLMKQRIAYKSLLLTFHAQHRLAPAYITDTNRRACYVLPPIMTCVCRHLTADTGTFSVAAPRMLNILFLQIHCLILRHFKDTFKDTHFPQGLQLVANAYNLLIFIQIFFFTIYL